MANSQRNAAWGRREFLTAGMLGGFGLTLGDVLRTEAVAQFRGYDGAKREGKAKSVIMIYLPGGIAHQELVDPKPAAPIEYRGEMDSIETAIPGVRFNELMVETSKIADRISVIRSMTHTEAAHERGTHNMFTGYRPSQAIVYPSLGSVVAHEMGPRKEMPPYVCVPNEPTEYAGSGYLSSKFGPFSLGSDPGRGSFKVRDVSLPEKVAEPRFERRKGLLSLVDEHFKAVEVSDGIESMDSFYQRAYAMLSSTTAREAFNIRAEPKSILDDYGTVGGAGGRMIMARRLIEAGVRFVTLSYGAWDTHTYHFRTTERQLPPFDKAYAALIRDLDQRGLLDSTLVLVCSEFGRTPMVNAGAGRDHWPRVFSTILAGGGIKRGAVYGASNAIAAEPEKNPVSPEDFARTIFSLIGIDTEKELMAPGDRPLEITEGGRVLKDILA